MLRWLSRAAADRSHACLPSIGRIHSTISRGVVSSRSRAGSGVHGARVLSQGTWLSLRACRRAAPLILYFDTSALVKLVIVEDGSDLVAELWATQHRAASSVLSYAEGRAALAAARRGERLNANAYGRARKEFESLQSELLLVGIDLALARRAGQHAEEFALRGYDAVHLASALALGQRHDAHQLGCGPQARRCEERLRRRPRSLIAAASLSMPSSR